MHVVSHMQAKGNTAHSTHSQGKTKLIARSGSCLPLCLLWHSLSIDSGFLLFLTWFSFLTGPVLAARIVQRLRFTKRQKAYCSCSEHTTCNKMYSVLMVLKQLTEVYSIALVTESLASYPGLPKARVQGCQTPSPGND